MKTKDGIKIGFGIYKLSDAKTVISFRDDCTESVYKILDGTDASLKLTAYNNRETMNISLSKKQNGDTSAPKRHT
jgi:hypothetical protein|tara:strand:+ start:77 stop:301 length:225 start_codon:yes stop_codon:yes gene_type:complete